MTPNEVKRMLHEVGNYRKTSEASFAVELKIGNPQTSLKNSARGEAALLRRVAPKGGLTVAPFGIFDKRKSPIPSQSHFASRFGLR